VDSCLYQNLKHVDGFLNVPGPWISDQMHTTPTPAAEFMPQAETCRIGDQGGRKVLIIGPTGFTVYFKILLGRADKASIRNS